MHLSLFFYLDDQIFNVAKIDKIISVKFLIKKDNLIKKLFSIILSVIFYNLYTNQNPNALYIKRSDYSSIYYNTPNNISTNFFLK